MSCKYEISSSHHPLFLFQPISCNDKTKRKTQIVHWEKLLDGFCITFYVQCSFKQINYRTVLSWLFVRGWFVCVCLCVCVCVSEIECVCVCVCVCVCECVDNCYLNNLSGCVSWVSASVCINGLHTDVRMFCSLSFLFVSHCYHYFCIISVACLYTFLYVVVQNKQKPSAVFIHSDYFVTYT